MKRKPIQLYTILVGVVGLYALSLCSAKQSFFNIFIFTAQCHMQMHVNKYATPDVDASVVLHYAIRKFRYSAKK